MVFQFHSLKRESPACGANNRAQPLSRDSRALEIVEFLERSIQCLNGRDEVGDARVGTPDFKTRASWGLLESVGRQLLGVLWKSTCRSNCLQTMVYSEIMEPLACRSVH